MIKYIIDAIELVHHRHCKISEIMDVNKNVVMRKLADNQVMNIHAKLQNNRCVM